MIIENRCSYLLICLFVFTIEMFSQFKSSIWFCLGNERRIQLGPLGPFLDRDTDDDNDNDDDSDDSENLEEWLNNSGSSITHL